MLFRSVLIATLIATPLAAQDCTQDAMIVFDGSGSMVENGFNDLDEPRIFQARRAVADAIPDIAVHRRLGLVIYGPGGDLCSGIDLRFGPQADAAEPIISAVDALQPGGDTALTVAVQLAADVLEYRTRPGAIVLVTDGKETCGGSPCQLAAELAADGQDLVVHVIGFKVRGEHFSWQSQGTDDYREASTPAACLADRTGGLYVAAESVTDLIAAFEKTLGCDLMF
ncbi:MAG: VWA domain-containing protein [Pseudomonadota bacterium]